jgi:hypothetical protein
VTVTRTVTVHQTGNGGFAGCVTPENPPNCVPPEDVSNPPTDFCETHDCIDNFDNGNGYAVQCNDGLWSMSGGESGACSYHQGESGYPQ